MFIFSFVLLILASTTSKFSPKKHGRALDLCMHSRLRTLPFLPPSQRPQIVTSKQGAAIPVDKVKVDDRERILRRGEVRVQRLILTHFPIEDT